MNTDHQAPLFVGILFITGCFVVENGLYDLQEAEIMIRDIDRDGHLARCRR